jgi:hypothetical protein
MDIINKFINLFLDKWIFYHLVFMRFYFVRHFGQWQYFFLQIITILKV